MNILKIVDDFAQNSRDHGSTEIQEIFAQIRAIAEQYHNNNIPAAKIINEGLARCYEYEFNAKLAQTSTLPGNVGFFNLRSILEQEFINKVFYDFTDESIIANIPSNPDDFLVWIKSIIRQHSAFTHPFYNQFLRYNANKQDIKYYLAQECTLDPRFDDLLALMQIGMPSQVKLELAANYWDEMGCGKESEIHTLMFSQVLQAFDVTEHYVADNLSLSALISGNLSSYLTLYRQNVYKAMGYFGVTEYVAPFRFNNLILAAERLGMGDSVDYHRLHVVIDAKHANSWFKNAILPVVTMQPELAKDIVMGALLRLNSSKLYLDELSAKLSSPPKDDTSFSNTNHKNQHYLIWKCLICDFIYNEALGLPEENLPPGTRWNDISNDWSCPDCGLLKKDFIMVPIGAVAELQF